MEGINILVATSGRLLDHWENTESFYLSCVSWVVIDEGNRLIELGFKETMGSIVSILKKRCKLPKRGKGPGEWKIAVGLS